MDASIPPYLIVRRPTLSWRTRVARVRFRACAAVAGDGHTPKSPTRSGIHGGHRMRLTGACVAEASSPRADKRRVLAFLLRAYDGLARAPTCSCVALTFRRSNVALRRRHAASISSSAFSGNCRQIASPITSSFAHPRCALVYTGLPGRKYTEAHPRPPWQ